MTSAPAARNQKAVRRTSGTLNCPTKPAATASDNGALNLIKPYTMCPTPSANRIHATTFATVRCPLEMSIDSYTRGLDDRPPLFNLRLVMRAERFRRLLIGRHDLQTQVRKALTDRCVGERGCDRAVELGYGFLRRASGHPGAVPDADVKAGQTRFVHG